MANDQCPFNEVQKSSMMFTRKVSVIGLKKLQEIQNNYIQNGMIEAHSSQPENS